jgi:hypothetical protein
MYTSVGGPDVGKVNHRHPEPVNISKTIQRVGKTPSGDFLSPVEGLEAPLLWCFGLDM